MSCPLPASCLSSTLNDHRLVIKIVFFLWCYICGKVFCEAFHFTLLLVVPIVYDNCCNRLLLD